MIRTVHYSLASLLVLALLFSATFVYAEDGTSVTDDGTTTSEDTKRPSPNFRAIRAHKASGTPPVRAVASTTVRNHPQNVHERIQTFSSTTKERREELRERGIDNASDRIIANLKRFIAVIEAGADRLTTIIERIESRMIKLEERGVDTSVAESHLDDAKESLRAVFVKIGDIKGEVESATSDNAREVLQKIRELLRAAKDDLKSAGTSIREAVQALKDAAGEAHGASTDTESDDE